MNFRVAGAIFAATRRTGAIFPHFFVIRHFTFLELI